MILCLSVCKSECWTRGRTLTLQAVEKSVFVRSHGDVTEREALYEKLLRALEDNLTKLERDERGTAALA